MSQQHSRRVELQISPEVAVIAMGNVNPTVFTSEPWLDPSVPHLRTFSSSRMHMLPPEYKVAVSQ